MNKKLLYYAEQEGKENLKFRLESLEIIRKESNTTLSFLIAGAGAALAFSIKAFQDSGFDQVFLVASALSLYLFTLSMVLVRNCLWSGDVMPPTNEPENLLHEGYTKNEILIVEVANIQERIDFNAERNQIVGNWLNKIRIGMFLTPIVSLVVYLAGNCLI